MGAVRIERLNGELVVRLERTSHGRTEAVALSFAEVWSMANTLRHYLVSLTPPEVPAIAAEKTP